MSVGQARFYSMRGSLSSGEFPLFSQGEDLSSYLVSNASVKYAKGLQTHIRVPMFNYVDTVNVCELDGSYYWVTEWQEHTTLNESVEMTLDYMGPTSLFRRGDTVKAALKRAPTDICPYMQDQLTSDLMSITSRYTFDGLDCPKSKTAYETFWIQISGHDNSGNIKQFGGFIAYDPDEGGFDWLNTIYSPLTQDYVPFGQWMTSIATYTGMTAEDIDDVSVSRRCPYKCARTLISGSVYSVYLIDSLGNTINPTVTGSYALYNLTQLKLAGTLPPANTETLTIDLSVYERTYGRVGLYDWNKNEIMAIPGNAVQTLTVTAEMMADISGIYCCISVLDDYISVPEGKLPYFGSTSATYKAYSMDTDRLAMQYAVQTAHINRDTADTVALGNALAGFGNNIMIGALGGNPVSVASGILGATASGITSAYESSRAMELSILQAQQNYELSEKRAIDQPSSGYNVGYGSIYAYMNEKNPLAVCVKMPKNLDPDYYDAWAENYGFPAEGVTVLEIEDGFVQGKLISETVSERGMYWDRCNETFMRGFKFVGPGEPVETTTIYYDSVFYYSDRYTNFAFYKNIRLRGRDAMFVNTQGTQYRTLMARGSPSAPELVTWYMSASDGTDIGVNDIEVFDVYHNPSKLVTVPSDPGIIYFSTSDKVYASEVPSDLSALLQSNNFTLRQRT